MKLYSKHCELKMNHWIVLSIIFRDRFTWWFFCCWRQGAIKLFNSLYTFYVESLRRNNIVFYFYCSEWWKDNEDTFFPQTKTQEAQICTSSTPNRQRKTHNATQAPSITQTLPYHVNVQHARSHGIQASLLHAIQPPHNGERRARLPQASTTKSLSHGGKLVFHRGACGGVSLGPR